MVLREIHGTIDQSQVSYLQSMYFSNLSYLPRPHRNLGVGVATSSIQGMLLALCSEITPSGA